VELTMTRVTEPSEIGEGKEWYSIQDLAEYLQVSPHTLYKWLARGGHDFPAYTRLPNRQVRVSRDDLANWMFRRQSPRRR
jgi:excisionase family DNA binding protein